MLNTTSLLMSAALLYGISASMVAWAAPTTTPLAEVEPETGPAAAARNAESSKSSRAGEPLAGSDVPNPSNTIKMLLELQAAPEPGASASGSSRPATRSGGARPVEPTPPANPFGKGDNPFGASPEFARPASSSGMPRGGADWQASPPDGSFTRGYGGAAGVAGVPGGAHDQHLFAAQRPGASSGSDSAEQRWWMPGPLIRWVRENRQEVLIGAAVALGLAWASSSWGTRRRR